MGKGNAKAQQSSMKLSEIGPRITMELYKVEKGLAEGDVLYHKFEQKTAAEASALKVKVSRAQSTADISLLVMLMICIRAF